MYEEGYAETTMCWSMWRRYRAITEPANSNAASGGCAAQTQWETVTAERASNAALKSRKPRRRSSGSPSGQQITYRDVSSADTRTRTIISVRGADASGLAISSQSPIGRGLIGHEVGDVVLIELPRGPIRVEILAVQDLG